MLVQKLHMKSPSQEHKVVAISTTYRTTKFDLFNAAKICGILKFQKKERKIENFKY